jgi:V8-like Glu-specific endopeptidase
MKRLLLVLFVVGLCVTAVADEGMWTVDNFPRAAVKETYGVEVTDAWLQHLQQSVVRLEGGCTGSFVSPEGLVLTNHHCVQTCLAENSTAERDLVANGFLAQSREAEVRCQNEQVSVLVGTEHVTDRVSAAVAGLGAAEAGAARRQALTRLEETCEREATQQGAALSCETVTLYQGGQYWLYKYRRYHDVRLVFAPEIDVAAFGGDPDNFQFPRWSLDMTLLRAYENGQPAKVARHLSFNWNGARAGEPVFVAGHPGTTERLLTVEQLKTQRDVFLPFWLLRFSELRGRLIQFSRTGPEEARISRDLLDTIENSLKVRRMQQVALLDDALIAQKAEEEARLKAAVEKDPALRERAGGAWDEIGRAQRVYREMLVPHVFIEGGAGFNSELFFYARQLVRAAEERQKPNPERLREYTEGQLPQLAQALGAERPVYPALERVRLSFALERMREWLGPDDPLVREVLGKETPQDRAASLIEGSRLSDPKVRLSVYEGGAKAVAASGDPMIALARVVDGRARELRERFEREVDGPTRRGQEAIAAARFAVYGTDIYPDATFTLRISHGAVEGWREGGEPVPPFTTLARLYERTTGVPPFRLPTPWLEARPRLDMEARANFVSTNDIVGGNSGSPMVNARGEIVGLVFDGNIHSISGTYWFDREKNRTVAVHPDYMRVALEQVYPAGALARELGLAR